MVAVFNRRFANKSTSRWGGVWQGGRRPFQQDPNRSHIMPWWTSRILFPMVAAALCLVCLATAATAQTPAYATAQPAFPTVASGPTSFGGYATRPTGYPTAQAASFDSRPLPDPSQINHPTAALPGQTPPPPDGSATTADTASDIVVDVRVTGNRKTPTEQLMRHIHTRPNRVYNAELVAQDVRRLNSSGLVNMVRAQYQENPGGTGRIVVFEVFERHTIGYVRYVGNRKIRKSILAKEVKLKQGDALDTFTVKEARRRLEAFYKEKGYPNIRVSLIEGDDPNDPGVIFVFNEGSKQTILWTSFEGNTITSDSRLRTQIQSKHGFGWIFGGEFDRKKVEQDVERLQAYYHGLGFFRVRIGHLIDEDKSSFSDQKDWVSIKFIIDEGPRYKLRNLSVVGNKKVATPELRRMIELEEGQPFNQDRMQRDQNAIKERYGAVGFIFADVQPEIRFLEEPGQLDLVYQIEEGERYRVGKIDVDIIGDYPHTQITTVLNRLSLEPGDIIDIRELRDSQRRMRSSQLFKVDPQMGVMPEIAFSPPTQEEIEKAKAQFAQRRAAGQIRGQNPSGTSHTARYHPPIENGDNWYNLTVRGLTPTAQTPRQQPPTAAPAQSPTQATQPVGPPVPLPPTTNIQRGQNPATGASLQHWTTPQPTQGNVTLGQYGSGGNSTPSLPTVGAYPTAPALGPPPAGTYTPAPQPVPAPQFPAPSARGTYGGTPSYFNQPGNFGDRDPGAMLGSLPDDDPPIYLPLRPNVHETETGRFMFSAGVNSDAGLIGSIVVDEQNFDWRRYPRGWGDVRNGTAFRGRGQRFRLEAMPGSEVQRYMLTFQEPYLFDTQWSLGLNGYYYTRFYREWDEQRIGGRVSLGRQLAHDLSLSGSFRFARVNISDPIVGAPPDLLDAVGDSDLYGFRGQVTYDTRDSTFLATEGHLFTAGFEQVLGTYQYPRADVDFRKYFMLHERPDGSGRHVLSMKGAASYSGAETPIYEHYFAGGYSTIRGFDFRGASPRVGGVPVGGEFSLLASTEYMFPLTASDTIRGVVFCDTGAVQPTIDNWEDKYRIAPGLGLRITIAAMGPAPIALDFAFPVVQEESDQEEVFSFFIGFLR